MTRSNKPGNLRHRQGSAPLPYTDHQKKTYEFANTKRAVRNGGVTESLTNLDIMMRKQFEAGIAGKTLAQRDYILQAQTAELARREHVEAECALWSQIKAANQRIIDQACATNLPIPRVLPHPDDIIIDWENGVRLPGPIAEDEWKRFEKSVLMRDALFLQQAMEDADNGIRVGDRPTLGSALLLATLLNRLLPPSLRLSDAEWIVRVEKLSRKPKRDALQQCRAAWNTVGARVARGKQFGTREKLTPVLHALRDMQDTFERREVDPHRYEAAVLSATECVAAFAASAPKPTSATAKKTELGECRA